MANRSKLFYSTLAGAVTLACTGAAQAAVTWQVQSDFGPATATRSVRGIALSPDNSELYVGFIQGTGGTSTVSEIPTATIPSTPTLSVTQSGLQPKGVATDDLGRVYVTASNSNGALSQTVRIYGAGISGSPTTFTLSDPSGAKFQLGGVATADIGGVHYAYVSTNKGANDVERFIVPNTGTPTLDTSWGTGGAISLGTVQSSSGLNGLEVAADGTVYVTGGNTNAGVTNSRGDTVYKISSTGTLLSTTAVNGAMDAALYGGDLYVAQYLNTSSSIAVLDASTLALLDTITPTGTFAAESNTDPDSGFAGITISSDGHIYVSDEVYAGTATNAQDRILVSSALPSPAPEPASLGALAIGGIALLARRRRSI